MTIVRACLAGRPWRQTAGDLAGLRRPAGDGPHYLSLVPTQLYRALAQPATAAVLAAFDAVLVGGASLDPALRDAALGQGLRVIRTYGMSETAGGVVYDGEPLPGLSVSLRPWPGAGTGGRIAITGPTCFAGYLGQPAASAAVLSPAAAPPAVLDGAFEREAGLSSPDGLSGQPGQPPAAGAVPAAGVSAPAAVCRTFLTSDLGFWDGSRLQVTGRIDDVVQSGGADVDLAALQRQLDAVFGSSQVVAFAVPDLVWGSRIMAATAGPVTADDVADRLGGRIAAAARPRAVIRVEAMPLTSSGKADRRALATLWEEFARGDNR
jgi:O-succinylbenzoic acid--CoA ligase